MDACLTPLASTGISKVLEMETFEKGDSLVKDAFKHIANREWQEALKVTNEALASAIDSLSAPFEALALNLRGTFGFLVGKSTFHIIPQNSHDSR